MASISKILIAYDGSKFSDAALEDLRHAGLGNKVQARVVTLATPLVPLMESVAVGLDVVFTGAFLMAREQTRDALKEAKAMAEKGASRLRKNFPDWKISTLVSLDSPAHGILKAAEKWKPSLIVMGSQGQSALENFLIGSVAHNVLTHATCNVRIGRGTKGQVAASPRVLLAVDGSKDAEAMVQCVANRSWSNNAEFRVVVVLDYKLSLIQGAQASLPERLLKQTVLALKNKGLKATLAEREGDPRAEIALEIKRFRATSLFVGSRGLHAVQRFFLGSVSLNLAEHASCTVEVVR